MNHNYRDLPWQGSYMQTLHIETFLAQGTCKPVPEFCIYCILPMCNAFSSKISAPKATLGSECLEK